MPSRSPKNPGQPSPSTGHKQRLATIGYEGATVAEVLEALTAAGVRLLVDVRAVASSRRPGFSKTRLAENLASEGIEYLHLRGLGTPADGRAAARAGHHAEMQRIFRDHLETAKAQAELAQLVDLVRGGQQIALLCFEADPLHCHRNLVAVAVVKQVAVNIEHLRPHDDTDGH